MNQLVEGFPGTEVIRDDFLIVGCDTTDEETEIETDGGLMAGMLQDGLPVVYVASALTATCANQEGTARYRICLREV